MEHGSSLIEYTPLISFNWTLVMNLVTLLVLYLILKKFFFEKIHNFILAREQSVQDSFDNAEHVNELASQKLDEYNLQLAGIDAERREIIKESKARADARAKEIVDEANRKASDIILQAEKEVERERAKAMEDMREQVASLALLAAEKIIEKQLDHKEQDVIINGIIEQAGQTEWKH